MHYKELEVWKEARALVSNVYKITSLFPKSEMFGLTSQINRSVVSIPSNIAEGCARYSDKDTNKFRDIALGSIAELDTQLILADDLSFARYTSELSDQVNKVSALLQGLKKYVNTKTCKSKGCPNNEMNLTS